MSNCHDLFIKFHDDEIYLKSDKKRKFTNIQECVAG